MHLIGPSRMCDMLGMSCSALGADSEKSSTSFPGFSPTRPPERERERENLGKFLTVTQTRCVIFYTNTHHSRVG